MTEELKNTATEPIIKENAALQTLFQSLESRIGYRVLLGGTRHFGYWESDTWRMLPVSRPLRRMEEKLFQRLDLPADSSVLDAGCGVGHVALYLADRGLQVTGIDVTDHHLAKAKQNIARSGCLESKVEVMKMDYQHLETLKSEHFDGVYTMETLVHAMEPEQAVAGFYRILRPGGRIVLHEFDYNIESEEAVEPVLVQAMKQMSEYGAMPTWDRARHGFFERLLEEAGFVDVRVDDYSLNVRPMVRLFWLLAIVPNFFIQLFGLQKHFINTIGGAYAYKARNYWRYISVTATKPGPPVDETGSC